jgi:hypothetical protein
MDITTLWRSALLQLVAVAALSIVLALLLPHDFFVDWGWFAGPVAWLLCAAFTGRVLDLPLVPTLIGAAIAGIPSIIAVVLNAHWAGAVVAVGIFAVWCARLPRESALA